MSTETNCCSEQTFERHPDPDVADIGQGGGAEFTVGRCHECGAVLIHCWAGGVVGGVQVVSQALVDRFLDAEPKARRTLLTEWFHGLT